MIAPTQIRPPENWQDFELLCKKLWGEIWNCSDTIKRNGRNGQQQHGVDIYGLPSGSNEYCGIQCKGKDNYIHAQLTKKEIDAEIKKAKSFKPALKAFYFTTTAAKDSSIEEYVREKNIESIKNGGFSIDLFSWEDIVDLLKEHRITYDWYINNCQYIDNTNVDVTVSFDNNQNALHPLYTRVTKKFEIREPVRNTNPWAVIMEDITPIQDILNRKSKIDYTWGDVIFQIENSGATVLEDYKLYINFFGCKELSCKVYYHTDLLMDNAIRARLNDKIDRERELFYSDRYSNQLEFRPLIKALVQEDVKQFIVGVKPEDDIETIVVEWTLLSRGYKKEGEISIPVKPIYEDTEEIVYVKTTEELKPNEIIIKPKIVEK